MISKLKEYSKKILIYSSIIIEKLWLFLKTILLFLFQVFIRWDNNHKTLSIIESGLTIFGFVSLIYFIVTPIYEYYNPPIDLIFHRESGKLEVLNEYKTLKNVSGVVKVNCDGANYSKSFDFKFLDGSVSLPKISKDFLVSNDKEFLNLIKNKGDNCAQGVLYVGRYFKNICGNNTNEKFKLQKVMSFNFYFGENGSISDIKKEENLNPIQTNFCTKCVVDIEIKASNLRRPKTKQNDFSFTTDIYIIVFNEILGREPNLIVDTVDAFDGFFPYGLKNVPCESHYCDEHYLCEEVNKMYPNSLNCEAPSYDLS